MNLEKFNYEGTEIRTVVIEETPYFVGKDVATVLGYSNTQKAILTHVAEEDKGVTKWDTLGGKQDLIIINESGLYSLILSSKLPNAKKFKKWVTSEVLPSIRKHGAYMNENTLEQALTNPDFLIKLANQLKEEKSKNKELTNQLAINKQIIGELKPAKDYLDTILASQDTMKATQIAADYGLSAKSLNKILHEAGVIRKVNNQWILYIEYMGKGYTKSNTFTVREDKVVTETVWTQKGRLLIHEILTDRGYKANQDKVKG